MAPKKSRRPRVCGFCGEYIPGPAEWPALARLEGNRCEACDKLLCPRCVRVDAAGTVYCEDCAEGAEIEVGQACVVCGCSDLAACPGGCSWTHDPTAGELPRCSKCPPPKGS